MNFQQWLDAVNGQYIDVDGFPPENPYQCWDLWSHYAQNVYGVPLYPTGCSAGGPGTHHPGYACEVWHQFDSSPLSQWFTREQGEGQPGDVAFWEWGSPVGPNSHVAVVVEDRGSSVYCMTQNPGASKYANLSKTGILGWLRPISKPQPTSGDEQDMRIIRADNGRVALIGEFYSRELYPGPEIEWTAGVHTKTFGEVVGLVNDEFNSLLIDAANRRAELINSISASAKPINVDLDKLAQAIADKINNGTGPDVTTKTEILEAITANYPEDK